jgi:hypothetical protein
MIKSTGTAASVAGSFILAAGLGVWGYCLFLIGSVCWLIAGYRMQDNNLMILNGFFLCANFLGLFNNWGL